MDRFVEGTGHDRIEIRFRVVQMWKQRFSDATLRRHPALVPLAVLSEQTTPKDLPRLDQIILDADLPPDKEADLRAILSVMAALRRFPKRALKAILRDKMVTEHPIFREMKDEARDEGRAEGRSEEGLRMLRRMLDRLEVQLDPTVERRLTEASTDLLEDLSAELVGLTDADAARNAVVRCLENGGKG